ncbi:MAG TPA: hypothetical protein DDY71_08075 [Spirochaetia bacterium]|nr:hypothetical protein [Spirochaetia bacterium]HBI37589.1 hypothetical protein [Spirochaetia bacterium]
MRLHINRKYSRKWSDYDIEDSIYSLYASLGDKKAIEDLKRGRGGISHSFWRMNFKQFTIKIVEDESGFDELNKFISSNRIISVTNSIIQHNSVSFWNFLIEYQKEAIKENSYITSSKKVDYKELMNQTDFALFCKLKDLRKKIADQKGIPVYNVLKNEEQ